MDSMLVLEALQMALKSRKPAPGLIHHSDRGNQYVSERNIRMLEKRVVQISISRVGMATDNAKIESFLGGFKRECDEPCSFVGSKANKQWVWLASGTTMGQSGCSFMNTTRACACPDLRGTTKPAHNLHV
jgi:transposase InsO family protein